MTKLINFKNPVDPIALGIPLYFTVVKNPMDLTTVVEKYKNNIYHKYQEIKQDLDLIVYNCRLYNQTGPILKECDELEQKIQSRWEKITSYLAELNIDPESELCFDPQRLIDFEEKKRKKKRNEVDPSLIIPSTYNSKLMSSQSVILSQSQPQLNLSYSSIQIGARSVTKDNQVPIINQQKIDNQQQQQSTIQINGVITTDKQNIIQQKVEYQEQQPQQQIQENTFQCHNDNIQAIQQEQQTIIKMEDINPTQAQQIEINQQLQQQQSQIIGFQTIQPQPKEENNNLQGKFQADIQLQQLNEKTQNFQMDIENDTKKDQIQNINKVPLNSELQFIMNKNQIMEAYQQMCVKKRKKYKKQLHHYLQRMKVIINRCQSKYDHFQSSETLNHFLENFLLDQPLKDIVESLNIRKIQLFLKMFVYWIKKYHQEFKKQWINKCNQTCWKVYKCVSRALVYKEGPSTGTIFQDEQQAINQLNGQNNFINTEFINSQIIKIENVSLNENQPTNIEGQQPIITQSSSIDRESLLFCQQPILTPINSNQLQDQVNDIEQLNYEKEMKAFRRMLERDDKKTKLTIPISRNNNDLIIPKIKEKDLDSSQLSQIVDIEKKKKDKNNKQLNLQKTISQQNTSIVGQSTGNNELKISLQSSNHQIQINESKQQFLERKKEDHYESQNYFQIWNNKSSYKSQENYFQKRQFEIKKACQVKFEEQNNDEKLNYFNQNYRQFAQQDHNNLFLQQQYQQQYQEQQQQEPEKIKINLIFLNNQESQMNNNQIQNIRQNDNQQWLVHQDHNTEAKQIWLHYQGQAKQIQIEFNVTDNKESRNNYLHNFYQSKFEGMKHMLNF